MSDRRASDPQPVSARAGVARAAAAWGVRIAGPLPRAWTRLADGLARRRVPLGFLCAAIVLSLATPTMSTVAAGAIVAALGEALRIWAAGHLNKSREVTASGPYRWVAHPLYAGSCLIGGGMALASRSVAAAIVIAAYLMLTLTAAVRQEEVFLRRTFGDRYDRYRHAGEVDAARRFSLAQAIANREYRAVAGLSAALLLLVLKATYNGLFGGR
jgi:protein-S-isoprenylcysteine O-methyltransferase Ste14